MVKASVQSELTHASSCSYEPYSVLMSVYYKEQPDFLNASIHSILMQTIPCDEFVIVCDGLLTPDLNQVLNNFLSNSDIQIKLVRLKENVGLGKALNIGIKHCKNSLIARMDSDDISFPDRCQKQLKIFKSNNVDITSGVVCEFIKEPGDICIHRTLPIYHENIVKYAQVRNPFNHPCTMFRKEAVERAGGYMHFPLLEDYYLWIRMFMTGAKSMNSHESMLHMRIGDGMHRRRGGLSYLRSIISFHYWMFNVGFTELFTFLKVSFAHTVVCLIPTRLRKVLFFKYLRKSI